MIDKLLKYISFRINFNTNAKNNNFYTKVCG